MTFGRNPLDANAASKRAIVSARTGSAPLNDVRHAERSSDARSASVVRSTQSSYAKFGAPLVVAR
jgi:hypothetical protein